MSTEPTPLASAGAEESVKEAQFARLLRVQHLEMNRRYTIHHQLTAYSIADMMREKGIAELHLSDAGSDGGYSVSGGITTQDVTFDETDTHHDLDLFEEELFSTFAMDDLDDIAEVPRGRHTADWILKAEKYSDPAVRADLRRQRDELLAEAAR